MPTYKTIHTNYGLIRQAAAVAAGTALNLTEMAIGDGNGVDVEPNQAQTQLVRERYRAPVNRIYQDPDTPTKFIAELIIPAAVGSFTMREVGVFDSEGGLVVVGNLPASVKPQASDGAFSDSAVKVEFYAQNASVITLQIDPNVVVATRTWITNNVTAAALLPGGTTNQVATKASNADGDIEWRDPDIANVTVDTIEETQALVDGQTVVTLTTCTTRGLAVYVDRQRVPSTEWTAHPTDPTEFSFNTPVSGPHELICTQNEPNGSAPAPLERHKNLADIGDKTEARENLGVYSREEMDLFVPVGTVAYFDRATAPPGWIKRNGANISRTAYARLYAVLGNRYGAGDGFNTFNVGDFRGDFIRALDDGRGVDPGRVLGSWQGQQVQRHKHAVPMGEATGGAPFGQSNGRGHFGTRGNVDWDNHLYWTNDGSDVDGVVNTAGVIGDETRPRNRALLCCIKY